MNEQGHEPSGHKLGSLYEVGLQHFQAGDYQQCVDLWSGALKYDPDNYRILTFLALAHEGLGRSEACRECLERAVALEPSYHKAWNNLGNLYRKTGELFRAVECYEHAVQHAGEVADYRYNLAITYLDTLQHEPAVGSLLHYRRLRPDDLSVLVPLAGAYYQLGRYERALQCLRLYLKERPDTSRFAQLRAQMRVIKSSLEAEATRRIKR